MRDIFKTDIISYNVIMQIFIVDDEPGIRLNLRIALQSEKYDVVQCINGKDALDKLSCNIPDLIILDYNMPIMDGFEFLQTIRQKNLQIPVIFLSDYADVETKVEGLTLGADDYLEKPFSTKELLARIKVLLRRYSSSEYSNSVEHKIVKYNNLSLDLLSYALTIDDNIVDITVTEFRLLHGFIEHRNQVLSRDQLMDIAYPEDNYATDRSIDSHIKRLRKKIGTDCIQTVYGAGYKFVE